MYSTKTPIEGYHIQIRDLSGPSYDVITVVGGGTRTHTLSDLRPDTSYSIFVLPFNKRIKGMPSNMKTVTTKEDGNKWRGPPLIKISY